jgi:hypothetical protein
MQTPRAANCPLFALLLAYTKIFLNRHCCQCTPECPWIHTVASRWCFVPVSTPLKIGRSRPLFCLYACRLLAFTASASINRCLPRTMRQNFEFKIYSSLNNARNWSNTPKEALPFKGFKDYNCAAFPVLRHECSKTISRQKSSPRRLCSSNFVASLHSWLNHYQLASILSYMRW